MHTKVLKVTRYNYLKILEVFYVTFAFGQIYNEYNYKAGQYDYCSKVRKFLTANTVLVLSWQLCRFSFALLLPILYISRQYLCFPSVNY